MTTITPPPRPEKIAILGGGVGALSAAFELTESGRNYDITVYQLGWRLGGKGASGRNMDPAYGYRIEEHGLHIWTGLYDNAFRIMRDCYRLLERPPDAPLGTWQEAFKPHNFLVLEELYKGQWHNWAFELPTNDQLPGEPDARLFLPLWSYVEEALQLMRQLFKQSPQAQAAPARAVVEADSGLQKLLKKVVDDVDRARLGFGELLLFAAKQLARQVDADDDRLDLGDILDWLGDLERWIEKAILKILDVFMTWLWDEVKDRLDHEATRRFWIYMNFAYGNIRGVLEDDIVQHGFDVVDDQDYRAWLQNYLVDDRVDGRPLTLNSPLAWFLYDADFAYVDGDLDKPDLSASVALYTLVRLAFTWKGAVVWKMQAGMGDTVFTPLYRVLEKRGVKFKFFHRVKSLHLADDGRSIAGVTIGQQVELKPEYRERGYHPLVTIKGLECWPGAPDYNQIEGGRALKKELEQKGLTLEDWCTGDVAEYTLQAGTDFDKIVLGVSLGALPYICCDLIKANAAWKTMVDKVKTVRTQALQLWLKPTASELGWSLMQQPIVGDYHATPLNTWADMSHLLDREAWPAEGDHYPLNIAYFCGPMPDDRPPRQTGCGPEQDCAELSQQEGNDQVRQTAVDLLENDIGHLWPQTTTRPDRSGFRWNLLVDNRPEPGRGQARLDSQFIRANVQPSERYVMSVSGSTPYRLWPGDSGFENLYLAGDWTQNGFNAGGVEAAVMSGMLASNAISGHPRRDKIVGLTFGHKQKE